jgi:predicted nucleic acid-binding protein
VFDAWALLAFLQKEEPAAARVRALLQQAQEEDTVQLTVSVINLGEVYYILARASDENSAQDTLQKLQRLPLTVLPATNERVFTAARLKAAHAISCGDACAVGGAGEARGVVETGDPELVRLQGLVQIERLRRR